MPKQVLSSGRRTVRIVSWNIQWGRGADGRVDLDRTVAAIKSMAPVDVICLQEVAVNFPDLKGSSGEDGPAILAAAFPGHSAHYMATVDKPDGRGGRSLFGNLVLSRLPVGQVLRHLLPQPADGARPSMPRGCLEVMVESPLGWVRVLTTHLEYFSVRQRGAQVEALRRLHAEAVGLGRAGKARGEDGPFAMGSRPISAILCGDFNFEPGSVEHLALTAPMAPWVADWADAWRVRFGDQPHPHTVGLHGAEWPDRPYCCDYFVVTEDLGGRVRSLTVNSTTDASDHQPVILELA